MTRVSLLRCEDYSVELLVNTIIRGLKDLGFDLTEFSNKRVGLKPNLLTSVAAERAVITHPEFFRAVVKIVNASGGKPVLVESPAFHPLERVLRRVGYDEIVREEGVEIADVNQKEILYNDESELYKRFEVIRELFSLDILLNLPKFKTHGATYITAAVKNLFGTIPGLNKSQWHMRVKTKEKFSEILLDLYGGFLKVFRNPKKMITIMDAVVGLEGEGPGPAGKPKRIGVILVGTDAIAVDFVAANLVGLDVRKVFTITAGVRRGLGKASFDDIEISGDPFEELKVEGFRPTRSTITSDMVRWPLTSDLFKNLFVERPFPIQERCTLCYQCKEICPAGAIGIAREKRRTPHYDYKKCIRCFCCVEICPEAAIELKRGKLQWIMGSRW